MGYVSGYVVSDRGKVRKNNEDNYLLGHCTNEGSKDHDVSSMHKTREPWNCAAVFDGMGGRESGEVASFLAASTFQDAFLEDQSLTSPEEAVLTVRSLFQKANERIARERVEKQTQIGGTTCSAVLFSQDQFRIFHVGDSRIYLVRGREILFLTRDQTLAQMKLDLGICTSAEEVPPGDHHKLMEYLGNENGEEEILPLESEWIDWEEGDRLLLCSDGLYDECSDEEILHAFERGKEIDAIAEELFQKTWDHGARDNVTIVILEKR